MAAPITPAPMMIASAFLVIPSSRPAIAALIYLSSGQLPKRGQRHVRLRDRRRRLRRLRARQPAECGPVDARPRARGRAARLAVSTSSSTCRPRCRFRSAAASTTGSYESEPEPHMDGRRIYHARGKVLGGSSSINGMIFQRGNPLDYEKLGAGAGPGVLGLRALPAVLQADGDVPGRRRRVARRRRAAGPRARPRGRPALRRVLRRRAGGRPPAAPTTSTATARRASPRSTATSTAAGGSARRARTCTPSCSGRTWRCVRARSVSASCSRGRARPASRSCTAGSREVVRAGEVILCGGAINSPQLLQLSGVGAADPLARARHRRRGRPARRGRGPAGPPRGLRPVRVHAAGVDAAGAASGATGRWSARAGCSRAAARARPTTSRPAASSAPTTTSSTRT